MPVYTVTTCLTWLRISALPGGYFIHLDLPHVQTFALTISLPGRSCQRSEPRLWPTRQTILNWEMIQWCESLNPFAYFYWTWTHKLNPVHEEMQKGARTWLQDIFPNQNSILLIFFNSLTTSGMLFPAWWILGKWQTVGKETRVEG